MKSLNDTFYAAAVELLPPKLFARVMSAAMRQFTKQMQGGEDVSGDLVTATHKLLENRHNDEIAREYETGRRTTTRSERLP